MLISAAIILIFFGNEFLSPSDSLWMDRAISSDFALHLKLSQ